MKSLLVASLLLISLASRADSTCDSTRVSFPVWRYGDTDYSMAFPATVDSGRLELPYYPSAYAGFNFHEGRLFGSNASACRAYYVEGSETYRIDPGPSSSWQADEGAPVPITITLAADVVVDLHHVFDPTCHSCPYYQLSLQASSGERDSLSFRGAWITPTHQTVHIDLSPLVGEEFAVRYRVLGGPGALYCDVPATIDARIGFTGVPAGAILHSICRDDEPAVPTRRETWGSLKALYR